MIEPKQRFELEKSLINTLLNYQQRFLELYNQSPNSKALFMNATLREIYLGMIDHYTKYKEFPDMPTIYQKFINAGNDIREILKSISFEELSLNRELEFKLIEDSIEIDVNSILRILKSEKLTGLDYTERLNAETNKLLIDFNKEYIHSDKSNREEMTTVLNEIDETKRGNISNYIRTGFSMIDAKVNGIPKGHLTIIAGRPGQGKTDFMLQLKRNILNQNLKAGIISLEMTYSELQVRNISSMTKIDSRKIESGQITNEERALIYQKAENLVGDNYVYDTESRQTPERLKATLRKWLLNKKVDIVFIDYLTLIQTNFNKQRYDLEIGQLSQDLRQFAKETGLPIVILSQLNRQVESRNDRKPILSDLRESGQIEQDSKLILFLYRPMYYGLNPFDETNRKLFPEYTGKELYADDKLLEAEDLMNVIISKARGGQTGIVPLKYVPKFHTFENVTVKSDQQYPRAANDDYPW